MRALLIFVTFFERDLFFYRLLQFLLWHHIFDAVLVDHGSQVIWNSLNALELDVQVFMLAGFEDVQEDSSFYHVSRGIDFLVCDHEDISAL